MLTPDSPEAVASALADAMSAGSEIRMGGNFSKDALGGPAGPFDVEISTRSLRRVLQFEPKDLTISVEAGLPFAELTRLLDDRGMMVPLDPPFAAGSTVGGVVAANLSGPRRRLYGAARDLVIGMRFATLEGKLVQSGGMVVKNVAGLDMGKLLIGSFGTLAAMVSVNFKLIPRPASTRTFRIHAASCEEAVAARDRILRSVLQPMAIDLLNPDAAARVGLGGWTLLLEAGGNDRVLARYQKELDVADVVDGAVWEKIRGFTSDYLAELPGRWVSSKSHALTGLRAAIESWPGPAVARAASGITYLYGENGTRPDIWSGEGSDFELMRRVKNLFDPKGVLNRGRLHGRI